MEEHSYNLYLYVHKNSTRVLIPTYDSVSRKIISVTGYYLPFSSCLGFSSMFPLFLGLLGFLDFYLRSSNSTTFNFLV
jgi:hypothetical protein